jgi:hypothetical protein
MRFLRRIGVVDPRNSIVPGRLGIVGRRSGWVVRRVPGLQAGVGRRPSYPRARGRGAPGVGRRATGGPSGARAASGRRASSVGHSGFLKCFYEFFCFSLIYTLHFVIPSIK